MNKKKSDSSLVSNRKAYHDYTILETFEAGIVLVGTEIKSLRNHGGSLQEAYIVIKKDEMWLVHCSIAPYLYGNVHNHEERRERKLLMHRREIEKVRKMAQEKSIALIPLEFYFKNGKVKVKVGVGKGKKAYDKRAALKEKEQKKEIKELY